MIDVVLGGKSLLAHYGLCLESCYLSAARKKQQMIDVPGADGKIDLLENWGETNYHNRTLTATFSASRNPGQVLRELVHEFEGKKMPIVPPSIDGHYMIGTIHVLSANRFARGGQLSICADCDPWLYSAVEKHISVPASEGSVDIKLYNSGRKLVVPEITVIGADATITVGEDSVMLEPGVHMISKLSIPGGATIQIKVQGGAISAKYREAILL